MDIDNLKKNFAIHWDKTAIRMLSIDAVQKANQVTWNAYGNGRCCTVFLATIVCPST